MLSQPASAWLVIPFPSLSPQLLDSPFRGILRGGKATKLDAWLRDARGSGIGALRRFARTLSRDLEAVRNAITETWSNGQTEGQINELKTLKRAMYGRAGAELLRARLLPLEVAE